MKVLITLTMEVPNEKNLDEVEELIQNWISEADYVMKNRHFNERRLPTDPCVQEVQEFPEIKKF